MLTIRTALAVNLMALVAENLDTVLLYCISHLLGC